MGGGPTVTYQPPKQDDTFANYLKYQQESEKIAADKAATAEAERKTEAAARKAAGAAGYAGLKRTTQEQLAQGLIGYESAVNQLRDYSARYDLTPPEADIQELTQQYTAALPGKRATGISAAIEEFLNRPATEEEITKAQKRFQEGYYGTMEDFKGSLAKSPEYQKKFNQSYLDNYYDTMFGKQTVTAEGEKTGKRAFKFDKSLLPEYSGDLADRTKVKTPDFGQEVTGSPFELQEQVQNIRDTRQYLYSAGLTNLQGEIDSQVQKLKNEGSKEVAKISSWGNVMSSALSGFWS
jgi:hypothetical protein